MSLVARRQFLVAAGALLATPVAVMAQQPGRVYRVGWLGNSRHDTPEAIAGWDAFRLELQRRGWEEGRNLQFEQRFVAGNADLYPQYVSELLERKVDLIVATTGPGAIAAKKAAASVPIVFSTLQAPVEQGLVASLARPGGNVTGFSTGDLDLIGKRMQLLKETFPRIRRVAYLPLPIRDFDEPAYHAAQKLGIQLLPAEAPRPDDLSAAMASIPNADAWFVAERFTYFAYRKTIIELIAKQRKPAMYPSTFFVYAGGLMSYSVDQPELYRGVAALADRILRGAKPADLPVQQPTRFELVINLKTAQALGLTIPQSILQRADRVIE